MSYAVQQKASPDGFVKPGELIDIRDGAELTLQDRRVFNLLIENAWSEIGRDVQHRIAMTKLRGPRHRGGERVDASIKRLMRTLVEVPRMVEGQAAIFRTQLLGETTQIIDENSPNAFVQYEFPRGLRQLIQDSRYWGRVKAYVMFHFSSKYALALYEALCLRGNLRVSEQRLTIEELRALLGVEDGKLPLFKNLKKWVIDPAVIEVNGLSDYKVRITPERDGGMKRGHLKGFLVQWEKKSAEEWQGVLAELLRPRDGRVARLQAAHKEAEAA